MIKVALLHDGSTRSVALAKLENVVPFFLKSVSESKQTDFDLPLWKIVRHLRDWDPALARHLSNNTSKEEILRQASLIIARWVHLLKEKNCSHALFETAASHHIETILFEIACDLAGVKKYFLEGSPFVDRNIILQQKTTIDTRRPMVSGKENSTPIELFEIEESRWQKRTAFGPRAYRSLIAGIVIVAIRSVKAVLHSSKKSIFMLIRKESSYSRLPIENDLNQNFGFPADTRVMFRQGMALRRLRALELRDWNRCKIVIEENARDDLFLVVAHSQPEVSSFPIGGRYGNHIDLIYAIRNRFPCATIIYREHPHIERRNFKGSPTRVGVARSINYYQLLDELGCLFLDRNVKWDWLENQTSSRLKVVSIGGKIALERALKEKKTIIAGFPWFKEMPGIVDLEDFLADPLKFDLSTKVNKTVVQDWLKFIHDTCSVSLGDWNSFRFESDLGNDNYLQDLESFFGYLSSLNKESR